MGSHILRLIGRHSCQDGQGSKCGRLLRGAAADVQGLLQADGHQQGWPAGQERPARRLRQRRCAHERVRARRSARRDLRALHLRWPARATTPTTSSCRPSRLTTTRARSTPRCSSTPSRPVEEAPEAEPEEDADAKKKKKKKKKAAK